MRLCEAFQVLQVRPQLLCRVQHLLQLVLPVFAVPQSFSHDSEVDYMLLQVVLFLLQGQGPLVVP